MKIGEEVRTPNGFGKIVDIEEFRTTKRYGIKLNMNTLSIPIAYYFENEISECLKEKK